MKEEKLDKKYGISTCGRFDKYEDENHRAYEPTPYTVLDRLLKSEYFDICKYLIDYGAGKSRVGCYVNKVKPDVTVVGVEYDEQMVTVSRINIKKSGSRADILLMEAENFDFPEQADSAYFFNPFSERILKSVMGKIEESYYNYSRTIRLFFYYPSMEYVGYLMCHEHLEFVDEIDCSDLFSNNDAREVIMIFDFI